MRFLKEPKFWGGVATGVVLYYVYTNYARGKKGFGG